jgi:hypothetical protein
MVTGIVLSVLLIFSAAVLLLLLLAHQQQQPPDVPAATDQATTAAAEDGRADEEAATLVAGDGRADKEATRLVARDGRAWGRGPHAPEEPGVGAPGGQDNTVPGVGAPGGQNNNEACWRLLLSRVERQWAVAVGARPEERGVARASRGDQLAEAVRRELERLREEVGISAEVVVEVTGDVGDIDTVAGLLAVGEALTAVAPVSERVFVELGPQLAVTGEDCAANPQQIEQLVAMVADAGLASTLEMGDGRVRIVFGSGVPGFV